ncbi:MAG: hypothetical protein CSA95_07600 [Bacteroidetes bacterium]|nr:MAG: hypothetical protein CSA95_07600 [Bacteroidota bacterium]
MKKIAILSVLFLLAFSLFAQRKPEITIEQYYHIQRGGVWFNSMGRNFHPITMGEKKTEAMAIYNSLNEPLILTCDPLPKGFSLKFEHDTIPAKTESKIFVTLDTKKYGKYGPQLDYFYVRSSEPNRHPYRLLMTPNVQEDFSALTEKELEKAPVASFDKTVSAFDTLPQMSVHKDSFLLTNKGKSDLYIRNVRAGCGCTHTKTSQDTIRPGEVAELSFEYRTLRKKGAQDSRITIVTNDPKTPQITLHIKGEVVIEEEEK